MPKIVDKKEKKTEILMAALRMFAKQGASKTKMADIAETAGIGKGTIYEYFQSKDKIFHEAYLYFIDHVNDVITKRLSGIEDPLEKLKAFFTSQIDLMDAGHSEFLEIMLDFWAEGIRDKTPSSLIDLSGMYKKYQTWITHILDECIKKGQIRPVNTSRVAAIIIGALDGLLIQRILHMNELDFKESIIQIQDMILCFLQKGE